MPQTNPPAPQNYNSKTHFLQVVSKTLNPQIRDYFDPNGEFPDENITTPNAALKRACLIEPDASLILNVAKMIFYVLMCGRLTAEIGERFYGTPKTDFKQRRNNIQAQVIFYFQEPSKYRRRANRKHPKRMRVSIPLLKDATQVTVAEITQITNRINQRFPLPKSQGDLYLCGQEKYSYYDPVSALQMPQIQAANQNQAAQFVKDICYIFSREFDPTRLNKSVKYQEAAVKETVRVLGESTTRMRRKVVSRVALVSVEFIGGNTGLDKTLIYRPLKEI
ncbi:hypothetical protein Lepto7376_3132 [[Leptolyngbya] sp. PCC 7376]|uniref:hypothetical protein n=1 Tax=[Leptolyngbya] sp. PCC 7376 TaxID=111781 RepID=UPI00029EF9A4|nr:hypothetical protein [[Leptolyngbya] sp. PCC 7376]AFY39369.1 hypothetical protein Lepto7376_3132 [[Leptolyngbya] sp. PCC 7376]